MRPKAHPPVISLMLAVPDAAAAAQWYAQALGATELWNLGSVIGLTVEGAPLFLGEPANNGWDTPAARHKNGTCEVDSHPGGPRFPGDPDDYVRLGGRGEAYFGRDVLRGLITGLREAASRPRTKTWWGPGVLGCAMWMDLFRSSARWRTCIVLTKQTKQNPCSSEGEASLGTCGGIGPSSGLAQEAYPELAEYAPREVNGPLIIGPGTPSWTEETEIGAVREVGFRRVGGQMVPIVHAKMALLGRMHWTDEHPSGYTVDQLSFIPERLWISSANFTESSRWGLEMGLWTDDPDLMDRARRFILGLVVLSEPFGTGPDTLNPELLPVNYDDEAIIEHLREHRDATRTGDSLSRNRSVAAVSRSAQRQDPELVRHRNIQIRLSRPDQAAHISGVVLPNGRDDHWPYSAFRMILDVRRRRQPPGAQPVADRAVAVSICERVLVARAFRSVRVGPMDGPSRPGGVIGRWTLCRRVTGWLPPAW